MIFNIRGTSGSGKSHLVRRITSLYDVPLRFKEEGRKQPIGYLYGREKGPSLAVVGHYETPCGGCDTIAKMEHIFELVRQSHANGHDVLFEGLLISADVLRTGALHTDGLPLVVVALTTPLDVCLASVNARRAARGKEEPVNPKNTESKFRGVVGSVARLRALGVTVHELDREGAYHVVTAHLGVTR